MGVNIMNCWNSSGISEKFQRFHLFQSFSSNFPWLQWNSTGIPPEQWKDFLVGRLDWLKSRQCSYKTLHFLSVSDASMSILSDIVIGLRKSHEIIFVVYFWKTKNTCERCFRDASETSRKRHLFWDMPEMS